MVNTHVAIWGIVALSTAGVIARPLKIPEAVWALAGAIALLCCRLLTLGSALAGIVKGFDVYCFLIGMMLLAEIARKEGLFDWLAAHAASMAGGSAARFFSLLYVVGIIVTVFLSNDATAVVLTPAVVAATRAAKVNNPLSYLFICAFIANAASFVLPISNPANLVIYGQHMPSLAQWLPRFALPSLLAILVTFLALRFTQRANLKQPVAADVKVPSLSAGGKAAAIGIISTAVVLMATSAIGAALGLPTLCAGVLTLIAVLAMARSTPWPILKGISWGVIPLVAGLFVLVEAIDTTGAIHSLSEFLRAHTQSGADVAAGASGVIVAVAANLINNLPTGLIAGMAVQGAHVQASVSSAVLIGVDLGPNLSVTGSLATILWLTALRREGIEVKKWDFLKQGLIVMPPALILSLGGLLLLS